MPSKNDCWGIEVGSHAIKAVRLVKAGGNVHLEDYAILPFKQVLTTPDMNVEETIQVQLDSFLAKHDVAKSSVVVSVSGNQAFARFAKLPPIEPKSVKKIVTYEAVQQIPFPIEEVEWDYQVFQQDDAPDVEVGIFAITKERIAHFLSNFNAVNLRVDQVTLSPLAVFNAFSHEAGDEIEDGAIYIDIGTQSTDVIIAENGNVWMRTLQIGGNNFTDALVKGFKLSFPKAEKLKKEARTSKYARQIFQAMRPVFADLVQEIQRSLGYYKSMNRDSDLNKIVCVGSTFRLPGLQKFLKQQLQMDIVRPDGFKGIEVNGRIESDVAENAINLATAYGLALQGLDLEKVNANVMPNMILRERMWSAKQTWFAGAAASLAMVAAATTLVYFKDASATQNSFKSQEANAIKRIIREAEEKKSNYNDLSTEDPRMKIENLNRMLDYRMLWPNILADVNSAAASMIDDQGPELEKQMAAFDADYDKITELPRNLRKRLYISNISAKYEVKPDNDESKRSSFSYGSSSDQNLAEKHTEDDFWIEVVPEEDDEEAMEDEEDTSEDFADESGMDDEEAEVEAKEQGPRIVVTIEGTTPYERANEYLTKKFINWFDQHSEGLNRPYQIEVPDNAIESFDTVANTGLGGRSKGMMGGIGNSGMMGGMGDPGMMGGMGDPGMMGGMGDPGMMGGGRNIRSYSGSNSASALLPARPLMDEEIEKDYQFTIKLYFNLKRASKSRVVDLKTTNTEAPVVTEPAESLEDESAQNNTSTTTEEVQG